MHGLKTEIGLLQKVYGSKDGNVSCIHQLPIQQFQNVKLTFSHPDWSLPCGYNL